MPRGFGGFGLVNVENLYYRRLVALACHLCCSTASTDVLVQLCRELDESFPACQSVISQAVEYCRSLAVLFDYTSYDSV